MSKTNLRQELAGRGQGLIAIGTVLRAGGVSIPGVHGGRGGRRRRVQTPPARHRGGRARLRVLRAQPEVLARGPVARRRRDGAAGRRRQSHHQAPRGLRERAGRRGLRRHRGRPARRRPSGSGRRALGPNRCTQRPLWSTGTAPLLAEAQGDAGRGFESRARHRRRPSSARPGGRGRGARGRGPVQARVRYWSPEHAVAAPAAAFVSASFCTLGPWLGFGPGPRVQTWVGRVGWPGARPAWLPGVGCRPPQQQARRA